MDDLAFLRARIKPYADYTNQDGQHLVDKQVRAYVGEALSRLRDRLQPADRAATALDALLTRCEFSDQRAIRAMDHGSLAAGEVVSRVHALDRALIEAAERGDAVTPGDLPAHLSEIDRLFDERFGVISAAPTR